MDDFYCEICGHLDCMSEACDHERIERANELRAKQGLPPLTFDDDEEPTP